MTGTAWLLTIGAVFRLTLLAVADKITRPHRVAVMKWAWSRFPPDPCDDEDDDDLPVPFLVGVLSCAWCASLWLAPPLVASGLAWSPGWGWQLVCGALTASGFTGALAQYASPD